MHLWIYLWLAVLTLGVGYCLVRAFKLRKWRLECQRRESAKWLERISRPPADNSPASTREA
jgi:hypothetical protein